MSTTLLKSNLKRFYHCNQSTSLWYMPIINLIFNFSAKDTHRHLQSSHHQLSHAMSHSNPTWTFWLKRTKMEASSSTQASSSLLHHTVKTLTSQTSLHTPRSPKMPFKTPITQSKAIMAVKINFLRPPNSLLKTLSAQGTILQTKARSISQSRHSLTMRLKRRIWSLSSRRSTMSKLVGSTCLDKASSAALRNDKSSQLRLVTTIQLDRGGNHSLDLITIIRLHYYRTRRLTPREINYKLTLCLDSAMFRLQ